VEIPKPDGGVRKLGIPTVLDRLIQQTVMQVLQSRWEPTFSKASYGFRPRRSQHQAIAEAQRHGRAGYLWVVDMDLEKFFDRVNHDKLMATLAKRITDKRMLRLIGAFLKAGVMEDGLVSSTEEGTPQGGPLSPLLSNIVLDALDKELERRKHRFVRYADDCNIYVRSKKAGERVMESVSKFITEQLKLKVNAAKSAVGRPWERKFLGFKLVITFHGAIARGIAPKAIERMKERIRELTRATKGRSVQQIIGTLRVYLRGWGGYYGYCQTTEVLEDLDQWIRRRIRCYYWRQWKRGRKRYAELRKRRVSKLAARKLAGSNRGPWRLSRTPQIHQALPNSFFDSLGLPRLVAIRPF
jgi:RNA-directed DNA polymerase